MKRDNHDPIHHNAPFTIALIAGEISGDGLAAELIRHLRQIFPQAQFIGITGEKMRQAGVRSLADIHVLSVHGLVEILPALWRLWRFRQQLIRTLIAEKPDLIIGVDAPEFNLGLLKSLRHRGFVTIQMVCPTIWAWRAKRIYFLKRAVDAVLCLYSFETALLEKAGIRAAFIGHPLAAEIPMHDTTAQTRESMRREDDEYIVTLLPGSRMSEINRHSALILDTVWTIHQRWQLEKNRGKRTQKIKWVAPLATRDTYDAFDWARYHWQKKHPQELLPPIELMRGHARTAIAMSDFCLAASGTVTLEVALHHKPMLVFYRLGAITYFLMKQFYRLPWFSLPNILSQSASWPEFLQHEANAHNLAHAFFDIVNDEPRQKEWRERSIALHHLTSAPTLDNLRSLLKTLNLRAN